MPHAAPVATADPSAIGGAELQAGATGLRLAFAGGGTGGHLVPGLHLVDRSAGRVADLVWFTSDRAVEDRVLAGLADRGEGFAVAREVLPLEARGGGAPGLPGLALRLPPAVRRAHAALRAHRVEVLLGLGGYATAPATIAARLLRIPIALLEINAVAGKATRALTPLARRVFHAWPGTLPRTPGTKHVLVGPPVGAAFEPPAAGRDGVAPVRLDARARLGFDPGRPLVVVLGGSQGAKALNDFIRVNASVLLGAGVQILHQVGPGRLSEGAAPVSGYRVEEYVTDVPTALAAADVALCRGGASTLAEIAAMGVPAWVVPFPHHGDRHQERNADQLGAGVRVVHEESLDRSRSAELVRLASDEGTFDRDRMAAALRGAVPRDAAERILDGLGELRRPS